MTGLIPENRWHAGALALSVAAVVAYLFALDGGHSWQFDDFAQYLMHARNIAELKSYATTGYVYNPLNPYVGPQNYPPVFPLMLAPLYKLFGLNLWPMKALCSLFFGGFIFTLYLFLEKRLAPQCAMLGAAIAVANPWFWDFRNTLYSDFPFLFFLMTAVLLCENTEEGEGGASRAKLALAAAAAAALAAGTRTQGMLLLPALAAADLWRNRRFSKAVIAIAGVMLSAYGAQQLIMGGGAGYLAQVKVSLSDKSLGFLQRLLLPWEHLRLFFSFGSGYSEILNICGIALASAALAFCSAGFYAILRRGPRTGLLFALLYAGTFFIGSDGMRYFFPLVPFLLLCSLKGYELAEARLPGRLIRPAGLTLMGLLAFSTAMSYLMMNDGAMKKSRRPWDVYSPQARELFTFLRREVPENGLICARKPRALALMSGKRAIVYHDAGDGLTDFYRRTGVTHVVLSSFVLPDLLYVQPQITRDAREFREVFRNDSFTVYALKDKP